MFVSCKKNRFVNACFVFFIYWWFFWFDFVSVMSRFVSFRFVSALSCLFLLCLVSFSFLLVSFRFCFVSCFTITLLLQFNSNWKTFKIYGNLGKLCAATSSSMYLVFFSDFQNVWIRYWKWKKNLHFRTRFCRLRFVIWFFF
jgi:hypothetical protein